MIDIYVEKFRPQTINDIVLSEKYYSIFNEMILNKRLSGNLLFFGKPGIGKTTLAKILAREVASDFLFLNASDERNLDLVRTRIKNFAEMQSMDPNSLKIVLLDEVDGLSGMAQEALKSFIEIYSNCIRIIATCNLVQKVIPALISRFQTFEFQPLSKEQSIQYIRNKILIPEKIEFSDQDLEKLYQTSFGDLRKVINNLQKSIIRGKLVLVDNDLLHEFGKVFKEKNIETLKKFLSENTVDFMQIYRFMFDKINNPKVLKLIADYTYRDGFVLDKEINFVAFCLSLWEIPEK